MKRRPIEMAQIDKYSTEKKKKAKVCASNKHTIADRLGAEEGLFFYRQIPLSETVAEKIAYELINYAQDESTAFTLNRFCKKKGISNSTFRHWCKKFPCLKIAKEVVYSQLAGFSQGIFYAGLGDNKGDWLLLFLEKINYTPEHIIFVDDTLHHVEHVHNALCKKNILNTCIRYGYADTRGEEFNPAKADQELLKAIGQEKYNTLFKELL